MSDFVHIEIVASEPYIYIYMVLSDKNSNSCHLINKNLFLHHKLYVSFIHLNQRQGYRVQTVDF